MVSKIYWRRVDKMSKYEMLVNVLDSLRSEAPKTEEKYHENQCEEKKNQARSLAYIHLFLKAYFNISNFEDREKFIVDGRYDGGIDAYYIDSNEKKIYFIQSKFRNNERNFENKSISINELIKMDIDRILDGNQSDEQGNDYNEKIINMQNEINELEGLPRYKYEVIILANLKDFNSEALERLIGKYTNEVIDYQIAYTKLLFPMLKGTCHMANEITVNLNVDARNTASLEYSVITEGINSNVQLFFIPTIEIARVMSEYKNSILDYNPRSFLGMEKLGVNYKIKDSIVNKTSNEFSLFNNGITLLSDETSMQTKTGKLGQARLELRNPQIINGGQTANTLANIYEDPNIDNCVFDGKEVLTKVITFEEIDEEKIESEKIKVELIENLSRSTNLQSVVNEADRRSNDEIQIKLQNYMFEEFGYCYNRKEGEFLNGEEKGYLPKSKIIPRDVIIRIANSCIGRVSTARRNSENILFKDENFSRVLNDSSNFKQIIYGYFVYHRLVELEKESLKTLDKYYVDKYGNSIRYGKYAVVNAACQLYDETVENKGLKKFAEKNTLKVLNTWKNFENHITKEQDNERYFKRLYEDELEKVEYNYDGYYKGGTIDVDISNYSFVPTND